MAARSNSKTKQKTTRKVARKPQKRSRFSALLGVKPLLLLAVVFLVGGVGTYLLEFSSAAVPPDNFVSGLIYDGLHAQSTGGCVGEFLDDAPTILGGSTVSCTHPDAGPDGVDVNLRDLQVDKLLNLQAIFDLLHLPVGDDQPIVPPLMPDPGLADIGRQGSLSDVSPRKQSCVGAGNASTYSVKLLYVYKAGTSSRFGGQAAGLKSDALRTNAVMYNSGVASGAARQIRFTTHSDCSLDFDAVPIAGSMDSFANVKNQLRSKGYKSQLRKYLVWVDYNDKGSPCGFADSPSNSYKTHAQTNPVNSGNYFAVVWHKCWDYGEPHELMHSLGAVFDGAPYSTNRGHCYDEHDVMCYNDGGHAVQIVCSSASLKWHYDCNHNTYFDAANATGWLATHWNAADSRFLIH